MQQQIITVIGLSSKKKHPISPTDDDLKKTVLSFLQDYNFPIASSCRSEQVCKKCIINQDILSCSITLGEFIKLYKNEIYISYL